MVGWEPTVGTGRSHFRHGKTQVGLRQNSGNPL